MGWAKTVLESAFPYGNFPQKLCGTIAKPHQLPLLCQSESKSFLVSISLTMSDSIVNFWWVNRKPESKWALLDFLRVFLCFRSANMLDSVSPTFSSLLTTWRIYGSNGTYLKRNSVTSRSYFWFSSHCILWDQHLLYETKLWWFSSSRVTIKY